MRWVIYKHTNLINGKVYIGQTCAYNPKSRWNNGRGYKKNVFFYGEILRYGWNCFSHEIITDNIYSAEEADRLEAYYISLYKAHYTQGGYNLTWGNKNRQEYRPRYNTNKVVNKQNNLNPAICIALLCIFLLLPILLLTFIMRPQIILNPITFIIIVVLSSWGIYKCSKKY